MADKLSDEEKAQSIFLQGVAAAIHECFAKPSQDRTEKNFLELLDGHLLGLTVLTKLADGRDLSVLVQGIRGVLDQALKQWVLLKHQGTGH